MPRLRNLLRGRRDRLERDLERNKDPQRIPEYLGRLDDIERRVAKLKVPIAYSGQFYTLREHIEFVRSLIADAAPK